MCIWRIQLIQSVNLFQHVPIFRAWADAFWSGWGCKSSGFWVLPLKLLKLTLSKVMSCYCEVHRLILWPKHWPPPLRPRQQDDHDGTLESLHIFVGLKYVSLFHMFSLKRVLAGNSSAIAKWKGDAMAAFRAGPKKVCLSSGPQPELQSLCHTFPQLLSGSVLLSWGIWGQ